MSECACQAEVVSCHDTEHALGGWPGGRCGPAVLGAQDVLACHWAGELAFAVLFCL